MSAMHAWDWAIVATYMVFAVGVGVAFTRRAGRSMNDYFLSGRRLPWWVLGTSMVATTFAADTPLAVTEYVRTEGIWRNWFWWAVALGHVLAAFVFARLWRRAEVLTDNELIELRYSGRKAAVLRAYKALYGAVLVNFIVMAWVIAAMATIIAAVVDVPPHYAIAVCMVIALTYSMLSGFWGVVVTDLVQFALAMVGSIAFAWIAVNDVGGLDALREQVALSDPQRLAFLPDLSGPNGLKFFVFITVIWWSSDRADGGGYIIQRMMSAKDERHALLGTFWFALAHYALRVWPWVLVALVTVIALPDLADHKAAYPQYLMTILPMGLKGVLVATFLAAFMSTIDTHVNWGSSYLVNDVYRRFVRKEASQRHYVWISRLCAVVLVGGAGIVAAFLSSITAAWEFVWALGAGIGLVLIGRWFWWRINAWSEISALTTSLTIAVGLKIRDLVVGEEEALGIHIKALIVVPAAIIVWITVTMLTKPEPLDHLVTFYRRVRPPGFWGPVAERAGGAHDDALGKWLLLDWVAGVAVVFGLTFGLGRLLLGPVEQAYWLFGAALLGGLILFTRYRKSRW